MSTKVESSHMQIEWRRSKVAELNSQGHSQTEISRILQVSIGTVNRDLSILRHQAKDNSDTLTSGCQKNTRNVLLG